MTINHVDQLAEWWENAEQGTPREGDRLIINEGDGDYAFERATPGAHEEVGSVRIMSRAPKPKPAWHDAVAVMARCSDSLEVPREVFFRSEATPGVWIGEGGWGHTEDLCDVTPLVEAKVTDEMGKRARAASMKWEFGGISENAAHAILTAALGLDPA